MENDMTTGNPTKHILLFSIPILVGNIFQQLYNMVDTMIVGKCINTQALASVGVSGALSFFIIGFLFGMTNGFGILIAQFYGAKDEAGVRNSIATSTVLSIAITIILTIGSLLLTDPLLHFMNTPDDIYHDTKIYISIIFLGIGCSMLYNMVSCILRAFGDSITPLIFLVISSIMNIILDFIFIVFFHMGVAGAAIATIISQGVSGVLCLIYAKNRYPAFHLRHEDFNITINGVMKHLAIGLPMALQFSITAIGVIILQRALNLFGSTKIASFTAATKVEQLASLPASTFGSSVATYTGQNYGAERPDRIRSGVRSALKLTLCASVIASLIILIFGRFLSGLFVLGYQPEVIDSAQQYLNMLAIFFPFLNILFIYRNALQGMGHNFIPLMAGVTELIMRSVVAFTLPEAIGYLGICLASPIAWIGACIPLYPTYVIVMRKMLRSHTD